MNARWRRLVSAFVACLIALLATPLLALAAYPPGSWPGPGPAGAFSAVVVSQNVCAPGGTIRAPYGIASLTVTIPAKAFTTCRQVTVYGVNGSIVAPLLPANHVIVVALAVGWLPAGDAAVPLTLKVEQAGIASDASVFMTTSNGLAKVTGVQWSPGAATVSFTTPPGLVMSRLQVAPTPPLTGPGAAATATAGRTPPATGSPASAPTDTTPFALLLVGLLVVVAAIALLVVRRNRRRATPR